MKFKIYADAEFEALSLDRAYAVIGAWIVLSILKLDPERVIEKGYIEITEKKDSESNLNKSLNE